MSGDFLVREASRDVVVLDVGGILLRLGRAADGAVGLELQDRDGRENSVLLEDAAAAYLAGWLSAPYVDDELLGSIERRAGRSVRQ